MIVRELDAAHDWEFGKGRNNYLSAQAAIEQSINTRVNSYLGDCFFDSAAGIDWFNLLGGKDLFGLELHIKTAIINTPGVTKVNQLSSVLDSNRKLTVSYSVTTIYSTLTGTITPQG